MSNQPPAAVRTRSIPAPSTDVPAAALAAVIAAHGGTLALHRDDVLNAPSHLDLTTTSDGMMTFTTQPDEERFRAATVRFDQWTTVRLYGWTAEGFGTEFVVTGMLARTPIWPTVGDHVPIARLELPGRGVLEDITARVTISNRKADVVLTIGFHHDPGKAGIEA